MSVDELKQERTDLRKRVTLTSKRLIRLISMNQKVELINKSMLELEDSFCEFEITHEGYDTLVHSDIDHESHRVVNGLDCKQYYSAVKQVYEDAYNAYEQSTLKANKEKKAQVILPIMNQIDLLSERLAANLKVITDCVDTDDVYSPSNVKLLSSYKDDIDPLTTQLLDAKYKLLTVQSMAEVSMVVEIIDVLVKNSDSKKSLINHIVAKSVRHHQPHGFVEQYQDQAAAVYGSMVATSIDLSSPTSIPTREQDSNNQMCVSSSDLLSASNTLIAPHHVNQDVVPSSTDAPAQITNTQNAMLSTGVVTVSSVSTPILSHNILDHTNHTTTTAHVMANAPASNTHVMSNAPACMDHNTKRVSFSLPSIIPNVTHTMASRSQYPSYTSMAPSNAESIVSAGHMSMTPSGQHSRPSLSTHTLLPGGVPLNTGQPLLGSCSSSVNTIYNNDIFQVPSSSYPYNISNHMVSTYAGHHPHIPNISVPNQYYSSIPGTPILSQSINSHDHRAYTYGYNPMVGNPGSSSDVLRSNSIGVQAPNLVVNSAAPYTPGVGGFYGAANNNVHTAGYNYVPEVKPRRTNLPYFSGERQDWPEFKTLWPKIAIPAYRSREVLAGELKGCLSELAQRNMGPVLITGPGSFQNMWDNLCRYYDNIAANVKSAMDSIMTLDKVQEEDYTALIYLVNKVESAYQHLQAIDQEDNLNILHMEHICKLLPPSIKTVWSRMYCNLSPNDQLKPFIQFMLFLRGEKYTFQREADSDSSGTKTRTHGTTTKNSDTYERSNGSSKFCECAYHTHNGVRHKTEECNAFMKLELKDKLAALKKINACFRCFQNHLRSKCERSDPCNVCGDIKHHSLMCKKAYEEDQLITETESHSSYRHERGLSVIQQVNLASSRKKATAMMDVCSDSSYITFRAAKKFNARRLEKCTLEVTTTGGQETEYDSAVYEIDLQTLSGKLITVIAYALENITRKISPLNLKVLSRLFPKYDCSSLQRPSDEVDLLLGNTVYGVHPKQEICTAGEHLSIMKGAFGVCLVGYHPELYGSSVKLDSHMVEVLHDAHIKTETHYIGNPIHREFKFPLLKSPLVCNISSHSTKVQETHISFINGDELTTEINPKCGSCKCGKCPIVGHAYSFVEEQELKMIQKGLRYIPEQECWSTTYPWLKDPKLLPDNYKCVFGTLQNTERTLMKDPLWASTYSDQIEDMLQRKVARKLTTEEMKEWVGPKYYISHLAVLNPKSTSTPVRVVFNSSQLCYGDSLNSFLAKGPDAYLNNLFGILLRWREGQVALIGDIKKMFNSILMEPLEQHCHRFLWRNLDASRKPEVYVMTRVNMGDRPSGTISSEAVYKTSDLFQHDSPNASCMLKQSTYVDDIVDSVDGTKDTAYKLATEAEEMLKKGGFTIKHWIFSGDETNKSSLKNEESVVRVLGIGWRPQEDTIVYKVALNFSSKKRGVHTEPDLTKLQVPREIPLQLTRRMVLMQVQKLYDPLGLMTPFTLQAKLLLRLTWALKLNWDEPIPDILVQKWMRYFTLLFGIEEFQYPRSLKPDDAEGDPYLIILSDGSDWFYGFVAYIRWQLKSGGYWCRFIMSKSRIAPLTKLSTPQMELNGAVLSKRGRLVIEKECRFKFRNILQIVDSETVLCMLKKTSHRFKVYEGVRIGEVQASTSGDMSCWAWMQGSDNIADLTTRCKVPHDINPDSEWFVGPSILYSPIEQWGLKFDTSHLNDQFSPGEKKNVQSHSTEAIPVLIEYKKFSKLKTIMNIIARILGMSNKTSFTGGRISCITSDALHKAELCLIRDIQKTISNECVKVDRKGRKGGSYAALYPVLNHDNVWVIGTRLASNPMTVYGDPQVLLPTSHWGTRLFMRYAHAECGHRGRDSTVSRFRLKFWTPQAAKLAKSVKQQCQLCKLRDHKLLSQHMGVMPLERVKLSPAWCRTMVDIFGPYSIKGEVQKRTSGKGYG